MIKKKKRYSMSLDPQIVGKIILLANKEQRSLSNMAEILLCRGLKIFSREMHVSLEKGDN